MIKKVFFLQLQASLKQLKEPSFPNCILMGNDPYLIELSCQQLKEKKHSISHNNLVDLIDIDINAQTDWDFLFESIYSSGLFDNDKLFILRFNSATINASLQSNLEKLIQARSQTASFIFVFPQYSKTIESQSVFKSLSPLWLIPCSVFDAVQLKQWLNQKGIALNLKLDQEVIERLIYNYEGNLYALDQLMQQLSILYPNQKTVSLNEVESLLNDVALFTPYHWIDAILTFKTKRAIHVLQQLQKEEIQPLILLRVYQKELLQWIDLKKGSLRFDLNTLFNEFKIWQNRRAILTHYIHSISLETLYDLLRKLKQIEIELKTNSNPLIWEQFTQLTLDSCDEKKLN